MDAPRPSQSTDPRSAEDARTDAEGQADTVTIGAGNPMFVMEAPAPSHIGRYIVLGSLGRGASGEVYAAYDPQLDRKVAVKLLRGWGATESDEMRARLVREAQTMARLAHPNVVTVHDVGVADDRVFMAMELLEGTTLRKWRAEGDRSWRECVRVYVAAGRGLAAAHAAGIVHCDFKPDNVLISHGGTVKVTDFGIAHGRAAATKPEEASASPLPPSASSSSSPSSVPSPSSSSPTSLVGMSLTEDGVIQGTPGYMAPEQYTGAEIDARTDQFCFCVALYEALYRERPFEGGAFDAQMSAVLDGHVRAPKRGTRVPARVRRILLRGLSRDPSQRYPDLESLLADLQRDPARTLRLTAAAVAALVLVGGGVSQAQRAASGREAQVCSGGAQLVEEVWSPKVQSAIARAFAASGVRTSDEAWTKAQAGLDAYAKRWTAAHYDACVATRVRGVQSEAAMQLRMTCLEARRRQLGALGRHLETPDAEVIAKAAQAAYALPDVEACADVAALTSVEALPAAAAARAQIDAVRGELSDVRAIVPFGHVEIMGPRLRALDERAKATGYAPLEAEVAMEWGALLHVAGDAEAIDVYKEAILAAERGRSDDVKVAAESSLAHLLANRHRFDEAREWLALGRATAVHADRRLEARLLKVEGWLEYEQDHFDKADAAFGRSLAAYAEFSPRSPDRALLMSGAAMIALMVGDAPRATSMSAASDALAIDLFGAGSAFRAGILANRSALLLEAARYADALAVSDTALALADTLPATQNRVMMAHFNRVESLIGLDRVDDARAELDAELSAIRAASTDTERDDYGRRWQRLQAKVLVESGDFAKAGAFLRELLVHTGPDDVDAVVEALQAEVDLGQNAPRAALPHARLAVDTFAAGSVRSPAGLEDLATARLLLAEALSASGAPLADVRRAVDAITADALPARRRPQLDALRASAAARHR